ncbi:MAG: flagellar motor protein MotB [Gammaproteobacteria bacterium]|nr:flagellar motor protein MotB [Gammaproteobacteria bacterium]
MAENGQPIIVKKVKKVGHGGHHGGSWKVAYADFVTAMMAFFLLLWLLNASNKALLEGIARYFQNPSMVTASGGHSTSVIELGSNVDVSKGEGDMARESIESDLYSEEYEAMEMRQLKSLKEDIEYVIDTTDALIPFKDQLLLDVTEDGLRIQIVDKDNRPMFDLASAQLKSYAKTILREFAKVLVQVPNKISMSGHTDGRKYFREDGYSNWELSADRANAARRELLNGGYPAERISRVVGLANKVLFNKENPLDPINRRISIVILNRKAEQQIYHDESGQRALNQPGAVITPSEFKDAVKSGSIRRSGTIVRP